MAEDLLQVVVSCKETDSIEDVTRTLESASRQILIAKAIVWCVGCPFLVSSLEIWRRENQAVGVDIVHDDAPLQSNLSLLLSRCTGRRILVCASGVVFEDKCRDFLEQKIKEYEETAIITSFGICVFPHLKLESASLQMLEGVHWKRYDDRKTDRAVHVFFPEFCVASRDTLTKLSEHYDPVLSRCGSLWLSFIASSLNIPIWKIQTTGFVNFDQMPQCSFNPVSLIDGQNTELFEKFYSHAFDSNWISDPIWKDKKLVANSSQPQAIWEEGFGGVNMPIEPASEFDFAAIASYGAKVIRVGAVCDAKDLSFLLSKQAKCSKDDRGHLVKVIPRLRSAIQTASSYGLKVLITLADLPGCAFQSDEDPGDFWTSSSARLRVAEFWGYLAEALADLTSDIMGYDLINEPYTLEDKEADYFDDMPLKHSKELHEFYATALDKIRSVDKEVVVVMTGLWWGSPRSIDSLTPLPDPHTVYAVHVYAPPAYSQSRNAGLSYPGVVRKWRKCPYDALDTTYSFLHDLLKDTVWRWQEKHNLPSNRILIAEFGICREVSGAPQYLHDLVNIFSEFHWSWLVFSFRDEEWDALDYELGQDLSNMLDRSPTNLFQSVANHFH